MKLLKLAGEVLVVVTFVLSLAAIGALAVYVAGWS
jgi:hypothetical protein